MITWWAGGIAGTLYPLWAWAIPQDPNDQQLHQLLGLPDTAPRRHRRPDVDGPVSC